MNAFDRQFQNGSLFFVLLGAAGVLLFAVWAVIEPEQRYASLFCVLLGIVGTWRQYVIYARKRAQNGLEFIGTDPRPQRAGRRTSL